MAIEPPYDEIPGVAFKKGFNMGYSVGDDRDIERAITELLNRYKATENAYYTGIEKGIKQRKLDQFNKTFDEIQKRNRQRNP